MLKQLLIIANLLLLFSALGLGIFSIVRNYRSRVVQLWFLVCMAVAVWIFGYTASVNSSGYLMSFYLIKPVYFAASLLPILSFHFIVAFLFQNIKYRFFIYFGYIFAFLFIYLSLFTNFIVQGVKFNSEFGFHEEINGVGFSIFLIYFFVYVLFALYLLAVHYKNSDGYRKRQIFFLLLATAVGFIGGGSNFLTDYTGIFPYGQLFVWLYPLLITYGIFMDKLKIKF